MLRQLIPVSALLLGSACLLFAGGINGLILPIRGGIEGFTALSLAFSAPAGPSATCWVACSRPVW